MSQILDITPEQAATLTRGKTRLVKETTTSVMDQQTGELVDYSQTEQTVTGSEPDYIKVYYRTVLAFGGITDIPVDFLMAISGFMSWISDTQPMLLQSSRIVREQVCATCGIKKDMYGKYISRCVKHGLLIRKDGYRGLYEVNPFFIAKGRWEDIRKLRATFDFIDGKWQKHVEIGDD